MNLTSDAVVADGSQIHATRLAVGEELNYRISEECKVKLQFEGKVTKEAIQKFMMYLDLAKDDYPSGSKSEDD